MVPEVGLEPTWDCSRQILSLVRIPISPLRRGISNNRKCVDERQADPVGSAIMTICTRRFASSMNVSIAAATRSSTTAAFTLG